MADDRDFDSFSTIAEECWQNAHDKGWHDDEEFLERAKNAKQRLELTSTRSSSVEDFIDEVLERFSIANGVNIPEKLMLIVSEASEALEVYRKKDLDPTACYRIDEQGVYHIYEDGDPTVKPEGVGSELADLIIRVLDLSLRAKIPIVAEVRRKMRFNRTRPFRHGGKRA